MMENIPLEVIGSSSFGIYPKIDDKRTYNMFVSDNSLICFSGEKLMVALNGGQGRGLYYSNAYQRFIAVVGASVYSINTSYGVNLIGSLATTTGSVYIAENNANEIVITDGTKQIYSFKYLDSSFMKVPITFNAGYITFQNTYFIATDINSNQWQLSVSNNGRSWPGDAASVGALQTYPDICQAVVNFSTRLFVFGKTFVEIWANLPGRSLFPYVKQTSVVIEYGCASPASIASAFNLLVWFGVNKQGKPVILVSEGGNPTPISTDGWNYVFDNLKNPSNCFGFLYQQDGHIFYQLTFADPSDNLTLVYDFTTKKFYHRTDKRLNYHPAKYAALLEGRLHYLDQTSGSLYKIDSSYSTYDGATIPRIRVCNHLRLPMAQNFILNEIGLITLQGNSDKDQYIDLSISKDGGYTYGSSIRKQLNPIGNRSNKCRFFNLGGGNDLVPQFRFWGDSQFIITDAYARILH